MTPEQGQQPTTTDHAPDNTAPGSDLEGGNTDTTRSSTLRRNGIYIQGAVEGVDVNFAVDTGATTTIISASLYNRIPTERRPRLKPTRPLNVADGKPLETLGHGTFSVKLGPLQLHRKMTVANIPGDVLLGVDVIQNGSRGPADIIYSERRMVLHGVSIPLLFGRPETTQKAYGEDHYCTIPRVCEEAENKFQEIYTAAEDVFIEPETDLHFIDAPQGDETTMKVRASKLQEPDSSREDLRRTTTTVYAGDGTPPVPAVPTWQSHATVVFKRAAVMLLMVVLLVFGVPHTFNPVEATQVYFHQESQDGPFPARMDEHLTPAIFRSRQQDDDGRTRPKLEAHSHASSSPHSPEGTTTQHEREDDTSPARGSMRHQLNIQQTCNKNYHGCEHSAATSEHHHAHRYGTCV